MLSAWTSSILPSVGAGRIKEQEGLMLNTPLSLKPEGSKGTGPWCGAFVIFTGKGKGNVTPPAPSSSEKVYSN